MAGGLYDQKPEILDRFRYMFFKINEQREKEEAERERKAPKPPRTSRRGISRPSY
jgi:hypothetical protein